MLIRREASGDTDAIREVTAAAFARPGYVPVELSVRPDVQRTGVGSALMHAVLGAGDALGEPLVALIGDPGYYGRFGFRPGAEYQISPVVASWVPVFQVRLLTGYQPEVRGTFRFAEPFDQT